MVVETLASVLRLIRKGLDILHRPERRLHPDSCPSRISAVSLLLSWGTSPSVPCVVLWSVHNPASVYQSLCSGFEWAHRRGVCLLRYLDDWLVIAESRDLLLQHWELVYQLCGDLGIIINWEKSDLQPSCVQYLGMLIDTSLESFPVKSSFSGSGDVFSSASIAPSMDVAAAVGPHGVTGVLSSQGSHEHASPRVLPQGPLVSHGRLPGRSGSRSASRQFGGGSRRTDGCPGFLFRYLPHPCRCIPMHLCLVGNSHVGSDGIWGLVQGRK